MSATANRNTGLDRDGEVWAQGTHTDLWRCLTAKFAPCRWNDLVAERGPVRTVVPAVEMYQPVR